MKHKTGIYFNILPRNHARPMREYIDYDYINRLTKGAKSDNEVYAKECLEALSFLDKFSAEFYKGFFHKEKESIHPDNMRKDCYQRVNQNKRDMSSWYYRTETDVYDDGGYKDGE